VLILGSSPVDLIPRLLRSMVLWPFSPWIDGVYWTLPIELIFYVAVGLVISIAGARYIPHLLLGLAGWGASYWIVRGVFAASGNSFVPLPGDMLVLTLAPHGANFALGGLLYYILCVERR